MNDFAINTTEAGYLASTQALLTQSEPDGAVTEDSDAWRDYWRARKQPWRSEPEIDVQRQVILDGYRVTSTRGNLAEYPFKDITLSRADIEWLLSTDRSSVDVEVFSQQENPGLDLRGADLRKARLGGLPLMRVLGGLPTNEWLLATNEQRDRAAIHLEGADLSGAHLEGADLSGAHLEGANLRGAHLEGASLRGAHLASANVREAHLERADLCEAHLEGNEYFPKPADVRMAFFDSMTNLMDISLGEKKYGFAPLADIQWGNANITVVNWHQIDKLGDEYETQWKLPIEYQAAMRANRQIAALLRSQGLNEAASHFIYRAYRNKQQMHPQQAILPVVLRIFVRERMPLPKVLLRLEERRHGQRVSPHPVRQALLRLIPFLLVLVAIAVFAPLILIGLLVLSVVATLAVLPIMRRRGPRSPQYRRAQTQLPPPGLLPQQQRRRQQWLLLVGFLLGVPQVRLPLLLKSPAVALQQIPLLHRLSTRGKFSSSSMTVVSSALTLLLLFDDSVACYGRYIVAFSLNLFTGYGYKLTRTLCWYLAVVLGCATLYAVFGHIALSEAVWLSLTSFHGRGFFSGIFSGAITAMGVLLTVEAIVGLCIELCFVVASLQRAFGE